MDDMSTVWQHHDGKFNDGVDERQAPRGKAVSKIGPHFAELMAANGLTEDDIYKDRCIDCKKLFPIKHRQRRCDSCAVKRKAEIRARHIARMEANNT